VDRPPPDRPPLLFSKKPREVQWQPKTLQEYQKERQKWEAKMTPLGADLENEDLLAKKARAEKIRQFSAGLRQVNLARQPRQPAEKTPSQKEPSPAHAARQRIADFAKNVPKPKLRPKPIAEPAPAEAPEPAPEPKEAARALSEEVAVLLGRHDSERAAAAKIRERLRLME